MVKKKRKKRKEGIKGKDRVQKKKKYGRAIEILSEPLDTRTDREIIKASLQKISGETLKWDRESASDLREKLKDEGMTIIDEANGLMLEEFESSILEKIRMDFPEWADYIERIQKIQ